MTVASVADDPLLICPVILLMPHIAGLIAQDQECISLLVVDDVLHVLVGEQAISKV